MTELRKLTIKEALEGLHKKEFTAVELTESHIQGMEAHRDLNMFITETPEMALEAAKASDQRIQAGEARMLDGIPVGVKDLFCTNGTKTTSASKILHNFVPTYESTISQNWLNHGTVMLGKTNMDEFAMGSANITSHFGAVKGPWKVGDRYMVPGGSSGGSAAAVATFTSMASLGSDTGGSIRQPASFCGIVGMKPTYGRCSRYGMIAFASSLDQAGVFARTVYDTALTLQTIMGHDPKDSTSSTRDVPNLAGNINADMKGKRIGIPKEYRVDNLAPDIAKLWDQGIDWLKAQGAEIVDITLPNTHHGLSIYYIIAPAEASSNLARYDGVRYGLRVLEDGDDLRAMYEKTRAQGFGEEVKRRIMIGTYVLSAGYVDAYYKKAQKIRGLIIQDFASAFTKVDAILVPATPSAAFPLDAPPTDPVTMYQNDLFTIPASMAGLPCISVPCGLDAQGLPIGLQIIGNRFDEQTVINVAQAMENAASFKATPQGV